MALSQPATSQATGHQHKRLTSSVLKAMIPRNHKRNPSAGLALSSKVPENNLKEQSGFKKILPVLPSDHPHAKLPLGEVNQNRDRSRISPQKPVEVYDEERHKVGRVREFVRRPSIEIQQDKKLPVKPAAADLGEGKKIKKSKSSTSISAFLSRPKSSKGAKKEIESQAKEKENVTPPSTANTAPPPIWAQFATQPTVDLGSTMKIPLNDKRNVEEEMALYIPPEHSPSKGRNFHDDQPTLAQRRGIKTRPQSLYLPLANRQKLTLDEQANGSRPSTRGSATVPWTEISGAENRKVSSDSSETPITMSKRGSRVKAAIAAWNGQEKAIHIETQNTEMNAEAIESAFEELLDSRNIDWKLRQKMRELDTHIKADFVRQDRSGSASSADGLKNQHRELLRLRADAISRKNEMAQQRQDEESKETSSPKKSRPRSLTFTLGKGDATSKKQKANKAASHVRNKSEDHSLNHSASSKSLAIVTDPQGRSLLNRAPKAAVPEDFISYLQHVQRPQLVEVGRLQKLRQLLRNETVLWVDSFITKGGMAEIVGLLYRIIDIEWREEHEDTLLHHTLTCLKALLTTSLALKHLHDLQPTLFPSLLRLLFSSGEEKKGPSEFSTRSIIISLPFTYLSASATPTRARTLLSYLRDPEPKDGVQLPGFISDMHRPRPYRIWCKEISDVTKEVFWIFLHHMNIIPYPPASTSEDSTTAKTSYTTAHFPTARPPVPAAPYVGGVEWEATTYLAAHLDLLNGLIASLPDREERNTLRQELRDSGFEKVMGATLRTCKEKFYGAVHAGLSTWVGAAKEDGWSWRDVREGPPREERLRQRSASPKKKVDKAPVLEMPRLELGLGKGKEGEAEGRGMGDGWL